MAAPKRVDANQPGIVRFLRGVPGLRVTHLHMVGKGCPDILVGFRRRNYLFELKTETGTLTPAEQEWHEDWTGQVDIAKDGEEILRIIGAIE